MSFFMRSLLGAIAAISVISSPALARFDTPAFVKCSFNGVMERCKVGFDTDGSFASLPDTADDLYDQRMTLPIAKEQRTADGKKYQTVPVTAVSQKNGATVVDLRPTTTAQPIVNTPTAVDYSQAEYAQPQIERTSNTTTETTIRVD